MNDIDYVASNGNTFTRYCNTVSDHGNVSLRTSTSSLDACIESCVNAGFNCYVAQWDSGTCLGFQPSDAVQAPWSYSGVDTAYIVGFVPSP